jgi:hypothetical protein
MSKIAVLKAVGGVISIVLVRATRSNIAFHISTSGIWLITRSTRGIADIMSKLFESRRVI